MKSGDSMYISPMLLQTALEPFNSDQYLFEPKSNGVRLLLHSKSNEITVFTRHGTNLTGRLPEIESLSLPDFYLDGELVCYKEGQEDFESVMSRINAASPRTIQKGFHDNPLIYIVFDILQSQGNWIVKLPLMERKKILSAVLPESTHLKQTIVSADYGNELFNQVKLLEMEGIVAKKKNSFYEIGQRSKSWLKIINWRYYICFITGFKKEQTGWLLNMDGQNVGVVEFGMNPVHKEAFYRISKGIITSENERYVYIEPYIRCKVKGRGILRSGLIMTPVFVEFIVG
ncbi:ATP-dependent DNA ligase [Bacillus sp. 1P06AnD]|uniref:ATP-dependent DNA ligase n=1 Tax=Bacillus sp. 1P06AnD TaxID=3132208 RepID=UPI0039A17C25